MASSPLGTAYEGTFNLSGTAIAFAGNISSYFSVTVAGQTRGSGGATDVYSVSIKPFDALQYDTFGNLFGADQLDVNFTSPGSDNPLYLLINYTADDVPETGCLQVCTVLLMHSSSFRDTCKPPRLCRELSQVCSSV